MIVCMFEFMCVYGCQCMVVDVWLFCAQLGFLVNPCSLSLRYS